ncbi:hormogonium polysaccharide biosynthesis glycosyltransferase HpsP [Kamptonema animale CS-326]|jgi:glycosyltransferase involved in cell wall biosynthesis|uniref:hormogonium polysaccharide biosynthesis glycosyltransferase HpsP n=1 Tax=Kamptonema animale TaxID=92934 RepID=UPI002330082B|nr:hormogonium polysaccharide biosynthesis glycosyltransferase HpsP [Kamptonema animale]MDB9511215.1 hormogonium polysaccharide biosynthesis glycosyltransferase HpsP [Kamptonema animale CS-326]
MRILQIVPSISLVYGGPSQMVLGLSAALANQGIDVTILTTDSNGDIDQNPLDVPLNQPIQQEGYNIIYFRCSPFRRYKFSLSLLQWLNNHIKEFDLAHIHALFSPVSTAAATIARYHHLPYIIRPCGMLDPADLRKKKQLKQIYAALLERPNLAGAAAIHFTSKQEAKISERFGISKNRLSTTQDLIIPLGVTNFAENSSIKSEQLPIHNQFNINSGDSQIPQILFMSRIEPKKGLNLLIPALEKILAQGIKFNFILAGSNPQDADYEMKIKEQIDNSPLARHTIMTGFVTGEIKTYLLQNADLFVLPSYYENFGIAVAEAMAAGTPVVISERVHIWEDIQQAEAGWVGPLEVDAIASLITIALLDVDERKRRGLNGREYARKHYSWDAIAQQTIQAYQQILKPGNF